MNRDYANDKLNKWLIEILPELRKVSHYRFQDIDVESLIQDSVIVLLIKIKNGEFSIENQGLHKNDSKKSDSLEQQKHPKEKIFNYLYSLVRWRSIDEYRKQKTFTHIDFDETTLHIEPQADAPLEKGLNYMHILIARLPEEQKSVVKEKLKGKTSMEVAETLNKKPATVRSLWRFAKLNLSEMVDEKDIIDLGD